MVMHDFDACDGVAIKTNATITTARMGGSVPDHCGRRRVMNHLEQNRIQEVANYGRF
jgi:hypothetical protein